MSRLDRIGFDVVSICSIKNDDVAVASVGRDGKPPSLVAVEPAFYLCDGHVNVMGFVIERSLWNRFH